MTFDQIVARIATDLNISAAASLVRIGEHVNLRYRYVLSEIGMNDFSRVSFEAELEPNTREQAVTSDNDPIIERIVAIYRRADSDTTPVDEHTRWVPMDDLTYEEMQEEMLRSDIATKWAKKRVGATSTTFLINSSVPNGQTVLIEGEEHSSELAGDDVPAFPESFHNILVLGGKVDELRKMEKYPMADRLEGQPLANGLPALPGTFFGDLARLKLKTTLMAYGDIRQGKHGRLNFQRPGRRGRW